MPELPEDERRSIFEHKILPLWVEGVPRQDQPVVVFVAGQPGSGKTRAADRVHRVFEGRGGAVRIGSDLYKEDHPRYKDLLAEDVRTAGIGVRRETRNWQRNIEAHARASRYDAVVETALADPEEFRLSAAAFRDAGFRTEVLALAVPEAVSQLSLLERFLDEAVDERGGRYVSGDNHDDCAAGLLRTLAAVEAEQSVDRIAVVRRDWTVLYDNELTSGTWRQPPGADQAVKQERNRPWGARETVQFEQQLAQATMRLGQLPHEDHRLAVQHQTKRAAALAESVRRMAQPLPGPPGVAYHRLSAAEHQRFERRMLRRLDAITPQERPIVAFVMAQPGAGKTRAADSMESALPDAIRISSDAFKEAHPDYHMLLEQNPRTAGSIIRDDCKAWQNALETRVMERRGHMIVEVAPGNAEDLLTRVERAHAAGYRTHVMVIAARAAESRLGTADRYISALHKGDPARFTTVEGHDRCYAAVTEAVRAAETHPAVDSLMVVSRDGRSLWHQTGPQPRAASRALEAERQRPYTEDEARRFLARHRSLQRAMPQHGKELDEIATLARPHFPPAMMAPQLTGSSEMRPGAVLMWSEDMEFSHAQRAGPTQHISGALEGTTEQPTRTDDNRYSQEPRGPTGPEEQIRLGGASVHADREEARKPLEQHRDELAEPARPGDMNLPPDTHTTLVEEDHESADLDLDDELEL